MPPLSHHHHTFRQHWPINEPRKMNRSVSSLPFNARPDGCLKMDYGKILFFVQINYSAKELINIWVVKRSKQNKLDYCLLSNSGTFQCILQISSNFPFFSLSLSPFSFSISIQPIHCFHRLRLPSAKQE